MASKEEKLAEWHDKAKRNFSKAYEQTDDMRSQIVEAQRFVRVRGAQWEGSTNAGWSFKDVETGTDRFDKYPRFELNKVARECDRIISEYRKNRITVKFRPKDGQASEELAEKMNGKFRADYEETSGGEACDNAFDDGVVGGMGCWRLSADYEDEMDPSNEQKRISFMPVYDPANCVFFDQDAKQYDRSDAMWAMEMFSMTPDAFRAAYPDAECASLDHNTDNSQYDWNTPDAVYVGRYYEIKIENVKILAYQNPLTGEKAIYDEDEIKDIKDELEESGAFIFLGEREVKKRRVYCGLMSGFEWLEDPKRMVGEHIPLVPFYGRRSFVDNMERIEGHAAKAMDAQRLENLMVSMVADNATQSGGDNIPIVDVNMIPGPLARHWAERNTKRPAYLPMESLRDQAGNIVSPAAVSGYTQPTPLSPAVAALLQYTGATIQQITGSTGIDSIPSNIATDTVDSIFNRLDTQSFIYMDNMAKSMRRCGVIWMSMAREIYGSDKEVRIMNEDGSDDMILLSGEVIDRQTGEATALNDLSVGKYEVTVDVGQSFASRRDATIRQLTTILQSLPPQHPYYSIIMSMIIDAMDGEGISDLKDYNRQQLLLQGVTKPKTPEEEQMVSQAQQAQQQQPDPAAMQAQGVLLTGQADLLKAQTDMQAQQVKAFSASQDANLKQAQTVKTIVEARNIDKQSIMDALRLLGDFFQQEQDNSRANAQEILNGAQQFQQNNQQNIPPM